MQGENALLECFHHLGLFVVFVVMAEQVKHPVDDEQGQFVVQRTPVVGAVGVEFDPHPGDTRTDHDVADQITGMGRGGAVQGEREHVGRAILAHVLTVQFVHGRLVDEQQGTFSGIAPLLDERRRGERNPPIDVDRDVEGVDAPCTANNGESLGDDRHVQVVHPLEVEQRQEPSLWREGQREPAAVEFGDDGYVEIEIVDETLAKGLNLANGETRALYLKSE